MRSHPLCSGGSGRGFSKPSLPTSQYVFRTPLPWIIIIAIILSLTILQCSPCHLCQLLYKFPYGRNFRGGVSSQKWPKASQVLNCTYPRRDGQAGWAWVAWINIGMVDTSKVATNPSTYPGSMKWPSPNQPHTLWWPCVTCRPITPGTHPPDPFHVQINRLDILAVYMLILRNKIFTMTTAMKTTSKSTGCLKNELL